ncbi:MAG: hypothetical protein ABSG89_11045 [Bacteroidales bacterium]|jgi:tRNA pseudouridine55 synthase
MRNYDSRVAGILGTVIIHLIAGIFFMLYQIGALKKSITKDFRIEFYQVPEPEVKKKVVELPATKVERILQDDHEMLNIARNLANKSEEKINPSDYIDKVKDELIKEGKLGRDNYIDEQKRQKEEAVDQLSSEKQLTEQKENKPTESQKMEANYKGPTRIYYNLEGRVHTYLPIPIYKCEGSGKIELSIKVNQQGVVEEAMVISASSTATDPCLEETAVSTAYSSRFNADINSPKVQEGTLTYEFVAQ